MRVAIGLGNPGPAYVITRHNAGFLVVDALAAGFDLPAFRHEGNALVTEGNVGRERLVMVKPLTFMNSSGEALAPLLELPGITPARDLLVITDDFALPLGTFRLRAGGSSGGHNGLQSIELALGSQSYPRLRVGIGPLPAVGEPRDFVLSPFTPQELDVLSALLATLADAVECWAVQGIEAAMGKFNRRIGRDDEPHESSGMTE